ncbi:MAG: hypothetical protein ACRC9X_05140 [Bacteroidales bacterium]
MSKANEAYKRWQRHCETTQNATPIDAAEMPAEKNKRIAHLLANYGEFVKYYFPHYCKNEQTGEFTPCADFHIKAAKKCQQERNLKAVFKWARGHAKSTHFDVFIPLWLKAQGQIHVMVLVGKSQENANTLLGDVQAELQYNQRYINDFGKQYNTGSWQDGEFVTRDHCAFFARGRGQSPRGLRYRSNRPDYIVIDDLDDDELCENQDRVNKLAQWVKEALFGALDGGRGRFIMVGNLISKNSVLAKIAATEGVHVSQVNVYDKQGNPSWAAKWSVQEIKSMEQFMGYRAFQKEMMNNPITEGAVFKHNWIKWKNPLNLAKYDHLIAYCDPSFKSSSKNDYKAIKLWGKLGTELHHLEAFVRQCSVAEMVRWFYDLHERLPEGIICDYYMEANFLQDIILDEFTLEGNKRGYQLPIRGDKRKKPDKFQRIEGISPLWERGFVFYNAKKQTDPDMLAGIEQTLAIEKGSRTNDDAPDADEGAIYMLQKRTRIESFTPKIGGRPSAKNIW